MKLKASTVIISLLACLSMAGQDDQWFIGFSITPQHSFIFNQNDEIANDIPPGSFTAAEPNTAPAKIFNTRIDNGGIITPNSLNFGFNSGYSFNSRHSIELTAAYSYQQQLYRNKTIFGGQPSTIQNMSTKFNFIKFSSLYIYSIKGNDVINFDIGLGLQPSYLVSYNENYQSVRQRDGTKLTITTSDYEHTNIKGEHSYLSDFVFNRFNLEAKALLGMRWGYDYDVEYFIRLTVDHSLFDIENKSAKVIDENAVYHRRYHTPFKWARHYDQEYCPDCDETRPASYNFTAGISIGMRFYLD